MPSCKESLANRINKKKAKIAVIGLGYVGLPLAVEFAERGFSVLGIDIDAEKVKQLNKGTSYIQDILSSVVKSLINSKLLRVCQDYKDLVSADVIIISVPTPLTKTREPDISYIVNASRKIKEGFKKGQLIILESTTYPGTTVELLLPLFSEKGLKAGRDFFLAFSPERVDPGNKNFHTANIPKIVGGVTKNCTALTKLVYGKIIGSVISVSSPTVAETAKLLENTFRAVNIGLINEFALMCNKLKINIWEVIDAAKTKPFGFMPFYPGPGLGGHCLPIDPLYLAWKSRMHGFEPRLIELASQINSYMTTYVVNRVIEIIKSERKRSIKDANILVVGVSYKRDVSDTRESPALEIMDMFIEKQANVSYYDPYVASLSLENKRLRSIKFTKQDIARNDCVVIITDHTKLDYGFLLENSRLIFDTRNVYNNSDNPKVVRI